MNTIPIAQLSPEDRFQRGDALEDIFMPRFRAIRNKKFDDGKREFGRFIHYTSAEAALKIIIQKKMWMRNAACMSDFREVQHGFGLLHQFFVNAEKANQFKCAVDKVAPGVVDAAIKKFDAWWKIGAIQWNSYILSISEHFESEDMLGRLSMWRAFGGNLARVGLVLKVPSRSQTAEEMNLIFGPVAYMRVNQADDVIMEAIEKINSNLSYLKTIPEEEIGNWIFTMLFRIVSCVKHAGFEEEREWRAIYCPNVYPSNFIKPDTQVVAGVPQIVQNLPLDKNELDFAKLFDCLIIGPSQYGIAMTGAFANALTASGVKEASKRIFISDIPIRS